MYFNHAFRKSFLPVTPQSVLALNTTAGDSTADLAAGEIGAFTPNGQAGTGAASTKPFILAQGSYFTNDKIIRRVSDNTRYVIVKSTSTGVLVQSIDGGVPVFSDTFKTVTNQSFIATGVNAPDIDKYSGKLLYIDNRLAFTSTADQAVSIKTVFKY
jgi:hypothetical protein